MADPERTRAPRERGALRPVRGIHRKHMPVRGGENRDSAWYSIVDDEWPGVRSKLRRRIG